MNPTCYIINNGGRYLSASPAEIVRETKSTITVKGIDSGHEYTFQKRKRYGEDVYEDPRVLRGDIGFRSDIEERGSAGSNFSRYRNRLTFDVERVQERLASEKVDKERRDKVRKMIETVENYFRQHRNGYGDYSDDPDFNAVLDKLATVFEETQNKPV